MTLPLAGLALLAGCDEAAMQQAVERAAFPSGADLVAYDRAVASIGCDLVYESDFLPVEFQTGFTRAEVQRITARKLARDEAVRLSTGGVRLVAGPCAAAAEPAPALPDAA
ncbi:hypothetical protein [Roseivivax sp. CAU 1761]